MSNLEAPLRPKRKKVLVDYFVQFRWILIIFVVLPLSRVMDLLTYLGDVRYERKSLKRRQKEHDENVKKVVRRLQERNPGKDGDGLVCTARKPWISVGIRNVNYKRVRHFEVDLSAFRNILDIDKERMIASVEAPVSQISRVTAPMNMSLAVFGDLYDMTVGGMINGYGIEGSSHKFGLFSDTVVAYEIVLEDGQVVRATRNNEYSDLFYAIPWSHGTLGLLVAVEIKLIPVKEYVRLTYKLVVGNIHELAQGFIDSFCPIRRDGDEDNADDVVPDFVEGVVYSATEGVFMTGRYASKEEAKELKQLKQLKQLSKKVNSWSTSLPGSITRGTQSVCIGKGSLFFHLQINSGSGFFWVG